MKYVLFLACITSEWCPHPAPVNTLNKTRTFIKLLYFRYNKRVVTRIRAHNKMFFVFNQNKLSLNNIAACRCWCERNEHKLYVRVLPYILYERMCVDMNMNDCMLATYSHTRARTRVHAHYSSSYRFYYCYCHNHHSLAINLGASLVKCKSKATSYKCQVIIISTRPRLVVLWLEGRSQGHGAVTWLGLHQHRHLQQLQQPAGQPQTDKNILAVWHCWTWMFLVEVSGLIVD